MQQKKGKHKRRILLPNSYYHIYNRGNHKKEIFNSHQDYEVFLKLQKKYFKKYEDIELQAWCLMPNHFHYLVKTGAQPENLSKLMQCSIASYVLYFNKKYKQVGRLFQGRFNSKHLPYRKAVRNVYRYIQNNPLEANLCRRPQDYRWIWLGEIPFIEFEKKDVERKMEASRF